MKLSPPFIPQHVAIIMDGNRRWAMKNGLPQMEGHRRGYSRTKDIIDICIEKGIKYITFWAFSTENWKRDRKEVNYLMQLLEEKLREEISVFDKKGIRFIHLGRKDRVPEKVRSLLYLAEEQTQSNTKIVLNMAIDYGGRDEIIRAICRGIKNQSDWTEEKFSLLLDTAGMPDPDLLIRTSGEYRSSGFLLWQCAYAELYFTDICFPDFDPKAFQDSLDEYARRNRTHGV